MDTIKDYKEYKIIRNTNRGVVSEGKYLLRSLKEEKNHLNNIRNNTKDNISYIEDLDTLKSNCEKEFNIKMPFFYFTDINTLCNIIFITIKKNPRKIIIIHIAF